MYLKGSLCCFLSASILLVSEIVENSNNYSHYYMTLFYCPSSAIKVWDFQAALDPRTPADAICLRTLVVRLSLCPSVGYMYVCVYTFYLP